MIVMVFKPGDSKITKMEMSEQRLLEDLQKYIGGYIAAVDLTHFSNGSNVTMYVDDEGLLKNYKPSVYNTTGGQKYYVGPVVFLRYNQDGDSMSLTEEDVKIIEGFNYVYDTSESSFRALIKLERSKLDDFSA